MANVGICNPARLGDLAAGASRHGVATSTVGIGLGYDEVLLSAISRGGGGNAHFAEEPDTAAAQIASEVQGLLTQAVQAASLVIRPTDEVIRVTVQNDLPSAAVEEGVMVELGDLVYGETRRLLLTLAVPAMPALGLAKVADITVTYLELPELTTHTVVLPVHVNVVPGDEAAGRIANATVTSELLFQQAQQSKRTAGEALRQGDPSAAALAYRASAERLESFVPSASAEVQHELEQEAALLRDMADRVSWDEHGRLSKFTEADRARKSRKRGRRGSEPE
jgi:Ca-activated chloride channel family protein